MDTVKMEKQRKLLLKTKDDILYEKKQLLEDFEKLKDIVIKSGLISLICALLQGIFVGQLLKSKSVILLGLGRYLTPFILAVFVFSVVFFVIKGFDFFINADTNLSKKAATKFEKATVADKISSLNDSIIRIDIELEKIDKKLYGSNEDMFGDVGFDYQEENLNEVIKEIINEEKTPVGKSEKIINTPTKNKEKYEVKQENQNIKTRESSIDDILNALDSWGLGDDDDELENSSELWKRDSKNLS